MPSEFQTSFVKDGQNQIVDVFGNFIDFVNQAKSNPSIGTEGGSSFCGTKDFPTTVELALKGWPSGAHMIGKVRLELDNFVRSVVNARVAEYRYDTTGIDFDMGRALEGESECWYREVDEGFTISRPIVKIVTNLSLSASVSPKNIFLRGAAIVAAIDILESLGRSVEAWIGWTSGIPNTHYEGRALIKAAGQPMDFDGMAFALANPGCYRRLTFALMGQAVGSAARADEILHAGEDFIVTPPITTMADMNSKQLFAYIGSILNLIGMNVPQEEINTISTNIDLNGINYND